MIDDENDPRMRQAAKALSTRMNVLALGREIDCSLVECASQMIYDHRVQCHQRGIDFPRMVIFAIPRIGVFKLARADFDLPSIRNFVLNFVREQPAATPLEIGNAVVAAWQIRPGDLVDESKDVANRAATRKAAENSAVH